MHLSLLTILHLLAVSEDRWPHNLPLKVLCLCDLSRIQLLLNRSPILQKIIQNRIIEPHGHRGARRPVIVVIVAQCKVWVGIIPRCAALSGHQLDNAGLLLVQPEKLLQNIIRRAVSAIGKCQQGNTQSLCYLIWQRLLGTR